jgi:hypothetical protein
MVFISFGSQLLALLRRAIVDPVSDTSDFFNAKLSGVVTAVLADE